jgi:2-keto-4-pentenoate hydratase/2-oxohepta-3-ene-1,7-dioic acid hydratase in catechol pathway
MTGKKEQQLLFKMDGVQTGRFKEQGPRIDEALKYRMAQQVSGIAYETVQALKKAGLQPNNPETSKVYVTALLRAAAAEFLDNQKEEDPRWFVAMANAMLTIEGNTRKRKILFPLNSWYLPEEVKHHLVLAGLISSEEVGLEG